MANEEAPGLKEAINEWGWVQHMKSVQIEVDNMSLPKSA